MFGIWILNETDLDEVEPSCSNQLTDHSGILSSFVRVEGIQRNVKNSFVLTSTQLVLPDYSYPRPDYSYLNSLTTPTITPKKSKRKKRDWWRKPWRIYCKYPGWKMFKEQQKGAAIYWRQSYITIGFKINHYQTEMPVSSTDLLVHDIAWLGGGHFWSLFPPLFARCWGGQQLTHHHLKWRDYKTQLFFTYGPDPCSQCMNTTRPSWMGWIRATFSPTCVLAVFPRRKHCVFLL